MVSELLGHITKFVMSGYRNMSISKDAYSPINLLRSYSKVSNVFEQEHDQFPPASPLEKAIETSRVIFNVVFNVIVNE